MKELWKDVYGYEGIYQVSNHGKVKSLKRHTFRCDKKQDIILKPLKGDGRYFQVCLWKNGKSKRKYIHRLVAQMFIDNPENKPQVNHIDGNRYNNHISNLEWNTESENINHAHEKGLFDNDGKPKLTDEQVIEVFNMRLRGESIQSISEKFSINHSATYRILNRDSYKHVEVNNEQAI